MIDITIIFTFSQFHHLRNWLLWETLKISSIKHQFLYLQWRNW